MTALADSSKRQHIVLRCTICGPLGLLFICKFHCEWILVVLCDLASTNFIKINTPEGENNVSTLQLGTLVYMYASAVWREKKNSWINIFEVTNAKFSLILSYGMMHHCTKFGENWFRNFCVIASQTPKMRIFLINKEGGKILN